MSNEQGYGWKLKKIIEPRHFLSAFTKASKLTIMHWFVGVIDFASYHDFDIWLWRDYDDNVVFSVFPFVSICFFCLFMEHMSDNYHFVIEGIHLVRCMVLILKKQQQTNQPFSYIARQIKLKNTNTNPPDIQVSTMQRLMGEDENNFNGKWCL